MNSSAKIVFQEASMWILLISIKIIEKIDKIKKKIMYQPEDDYFLRGICVFETGERMTYTVAIHTIV